MAHYDEERIYLRLQKCASNYVTHTLHAHGICRQYTGTYHDNPATSARVQDLVQGRFAFTFVRHPLDWLGSIWRFRTGLQWGEHQELDDCRHETFDGYIENYLRLHPGFVSELYEQFCGPPDNPYVAFVGRVENVGVDLVQLFASLELQFDPEKLPKKRLNKSLADASLTEYRPDLRDAVMEAERKAIERFGYGVWPARAA